MRPRFSRLLIKSLQNDKALIQLLGGLNENGCLDKRSRRLWALLITASTLELISGQCTEAGPFLYLKTRLLQMMENMLLLPTLEKMSVLRLSVIPVVNDKYISMLLVQEVFYNNEC